MVLNKCVDRCDWDAKKGFQTARPTKMIPVVGRKHSSGGREWQCRRERVWCATINISRCSDEPYYGTWSTFVWSGDKRSAPPFLTVTLSLTQRNAISGWPATRAERLPGGPLKFPDLRVCGISGECGASPTGVRARPPN